MARATAISAAATLNVARMPAATTSPTLTASLKTPPGARLRFVQKPDNELYAEFDGDR
jgi:hypothetical protein